MITDSEAGLFRAVRECDRMEMKCIGKDGSVLTLDLRSSKKGVRSLLRDIAYALEDFVKKL